MERPERPSRPEKGMRSFELREKYVLSSDSDMEDEVVPVIVKAFSMQRPIRPSAEAMGSSSSQSLGLPSTSSLSSGHYKLRSRESEAEPQLFPFLDRSLQYRKRPYQYCTSMENENYMNDVFERHPSRTSCGTRNRISSGYIYSNSVAWEPKRFCTAPSMDSIPLLQDVKIPRMPTVSSLIDPLASTSNSIERPERVDGHSHRSLNSMSSISGPGPSSSMNVPDFLPTQFVSSEEFQLELENNNAELNEVNENNNSTNNNRNIPNENGSLDLTFPSDNIEIPLLSGSTRTAPRDLSTNAVVSTSGAAGACSTNTNFATNGDTNVSNNHISSSNGQFESIDLEGTSHMLFMQNPMSYAVVDSSPQRRQRLNTNGQNESIMLNYERTRASSKILRTLDDLRFYSRRGSSVPEASTSSESRTGNSLSVNNLPPLRDEESENDEENDENNENNENNRTNSSAVEVVSELSAIERFRNRINTMISPIAVFSNRNNSEDIDDEIRTEYGSTDTPQYRNRRFMTIFSSPMEVLGRNDSESNSNNAEAEGTTESRSDNNTYVVIMANNNENVNMQEPEENEESSTNENIPNDNSEETLNIGTSSEEVIVLSSPSPQNPFMTECVCPQNIELGATMEVSTSLPSTVSTATPLVNVAQTTSVASGPPHPTENLPASNNDRPMSNNNTATINNTNNSVATSQVKPEEREEYNSKLVSLLECPVCMETIIPPIHQCRKGHPVCQGCRPKLTTCPTCRSKFSENRNLMMEKVAEIILFPCRNSVLGCTSKIHLKDKRKHELSCGFRQYDCISLPCSWKGFKQELVVHVSASHKNQVIVGNNKRIKVSISPDAISTWVLYTLDEVFLVTFLVKTNFMYGGIVYLGKREKSKEFYFDFGLSNKKGSRVTWRGVTFPDKGPSVYTNLPHKGFAIALNHSIIEDRDPVLKMTNKVEVTVNVYPVKYQSTSPVSLTNSD